MMRAIAGVGLLLLPALWSCGGGGPQPVRPAANVPASNATVFAEVEPSVNAQVVYVTNGSSVPVRVTSIRLQRCLNVRGPCDVRTPLRVDIDPGQRRRIWEIQAANTDRAFAYYYGYTWATMSTSTGTPTVEVAGSTTGARRAAPVSVALMDPAMREALRRADAAAELTDTIVAIPDSLTLHVGQTIQLQRDLRVEGRTSAGVVVHNFAPQIASQDRTVLEHSTGGLVARGAGDTWLLVTPGISDPTVRTHARPAVVHIHVVP